MDIMFTIMGVLFVLLGLSLLSGAIVLSLRKWLRIKKSVATIGVVVENQTMLGSRQFDSSPRSTLYKPTVRFQTADGRVVDYTPKISNNVSNYSVGQNVPVYYNPQQPEEAIAGTAFRLWYTLFVFGFVGGMFSLIGTFFVFGDKIAGIFFNLIFR